VTNPEVLIEVLSESTEAYDRGDKFLVYRQMDSFREYVLIAQDKPLIEVFYKESGDTWRIDTYRSADDEVWFRSLGIRLRLRDIYAKTDLKL
jgi:Uma2 family endonuclease